jgi:hypothetical protein
MRFFHIGNRRNSADWVLDALLNIELSASRDNHDLQGHTGWVKRTGILQWTFFPENLKGARFRNPAPRALWRSHYCSLVDPRIRPLMYSRRLDTG